MSAALFGAPSSFSDAESAKDFVQHVLDVDRADQFFENHDSAAEMHSGNRRGH